MIERSGIRRLSWGRPRAIRFWLRVEVLSKDECWPWLGNCPNGRAVFWDDSGQVYAYRVMMEMMGVTVPDHLKACHTCDNPLCVNPWHIFVGTQGDNTRDMIAKGRGRNGKEERVCCKRGHPFGDNPPRDRHGHRICRTCRNENNKTFNVAHPRPRKRVRNDRGEQIICARGHRLEGDNLRVMKRTNGRSERICRECVRLRNSEAKRNKRRRDADHA